MAFEREICPMRTHFGKMEGVEEEEQEREGGRGMRVGGRKVRVTNTLSLWKLRIEMVNGAKLRTE